MNAWRPIPNKNYFLLKLFIISITYFKLDKPPETFKTICSSEFETLDDDNTIRVFFRTLKTPNDLQQSANLS